MKVRDMCGCCGGEDVVVGGRFVRTVAYQGYTAGKYEETLMPTRKALPCKNRMSYRESRKYSAFSENIHSRSRPISALFSRYINFCNVKQ